MTKSNRRFAAELKSGRHIGGFKEANGEMLNDVQAGYRMGVLAATQEQADIFKYKNVKK